MTPAMDATMIQPPDERERNLDRSRSRATGVRSVGPIHTAGFDFREAIMQSLWQGQVPVSLYADFGTTERIWRFLAFRPGLTGKSRLRSVWAPCPSGAGRSGTRGCARLRRGACMPWRWSGRWWHDREATCRRAGSRSSTDGPRWLR